MDKKELSEKVEVPEGITVNVNGRELSVKGPKGEITRDFKSTAIKLSQEDGNIMLKAARANRRNKMYLFSIRAHIRNMFKGVIDGHMYKLKICSGHFPMNVTVSSDEVVVKNFLGEKKPRILKIPEGVNAKLDGQEIVLDGIDIEKVGQTAANIEQLTRITNKDIRIFQDGIYIIEKTGKKIE